MTILKEIKLKEVLKLIMHNGLTTYRIKNSNATFYERNQAQKHETRDKKGGVFVVRSKEDFTSSGVKGYIATSHEALIDAANHVTHFTPNVYRKYQYTDSNRRYVHGFEEKNLQQVNVFVVDIDTKRHSVNEILMSCLDESIGIPTMILESDRGYQVYFALKSPIYISNKNEYRSLKVAKRISNNIKRSLRSVDADLLCNDFGFFRMPNQKNIVFYQPEYIYSVAELIAWSQRQDDNLNRSLFTVHVSHNQNKLTDSQWFQALLHTKSVRGAKGKIGRNNVMFTLALACYSDGLSERETYDLLDVYNSSLNVSIPHGEVQSIVNSAYSGKYQGPKSEYIKELLEIHVPKSKSIPVTVGALGWYKHKKERADRVRSHLHEWEEDIVSYIKKRINQENPFLHLTQKQMCEVIGIPQSTLNKLLKESSKLLRFVIGKGRSAKTRWTTVEIMMQHLIQQNKTSSEAFKKQLDSYLEEVTVRKKTPALKRLFSYALKLLDVFIQKNTKPG